MTVSEHLDQAEQLLEAAYTKGDEWEVSEVVAAALTAIGHALVALAIESGAPHPNMPGGSTASGG